MKKVKKVKNKIKKIKINGKILKKCRDDLDMTQPELAKKLKVQTLTVLRYEKNRCLSGVPHKYVLDLHNLMLKMKKEVDVKFFKFVEVVLENE
jgi:DNA-binding XRE family transcriptional regulator